MQADNRLVDSQLLRFEIFGTLVNGNLRQAETAVFVRTLLLLFYWFLDLSDWLFRL